MLAPKMWGVIGLVVVLGGATAISVSSLERERKHTAQLATSNQQLATSNQSLNARVAQMQGDLESVSRKLADLENERHAAPVRERTARTAVHTRRAVQPREDPRFGQLKAQLSEQEKEIASTKDQLNQTRQDFEGKLSSTHDELSGSIARTHDELVALEKRGERNYYEFQLDKSKEFQKVGPIRIALRKANVKHKNYNVDMMVDDIKVQKKNVNLFEPVWITLADRPEPLQLVVNQVHKNEVAGYLSEPKYTKSQLAVTTTNAPAATNTKPPVEPNTKPPSEPQPPK